MDGSACPRLHLQPRLQRPSRPFQRWSRAELTLHTALAAQRGSPGALSFSDGAVPLARAS